jgi:dipeptidyl aminopeptidase/acylaminoacyl peptidase
MSTPAARRLTAADLWRIPRVGTPAPSPRGDLVVVGVTRYAAEGDEGDEQLWVIPTPAAGAARPCPRPLTAPGVGSSQPRVSPDGRRLAFVRKPHGGAEAQLHVMPLDGGEARCLTDFPLGAADPRWLPDGRRVAVLTPLYRGALTLDATRRRLQEHRARDERPHVTEDRVYRFWNRWLTDGEVHHVLVVDTESGEARDLIPGSERWFDLMDPTGQLDVSPDGEEIAFSADVSAPPHDRLRWAIFTVPTGGVWGGGSWGSGPEGTAAGDPQRSPPIVTRGEPRCLTPDNPADDVRPRYSPDGRWLVYGKKIDPDHYADRARLVRVDRRSGEELTLTEDWDEAPTAWEFAGEDTLVIEAETRGRTCLYRLRVSGGGLPQPFARGGALHAPQPAADGHVYVQHHTLSRPPEIARCPLSGGPFEVLSHFTDEALSGIALGAPEEMEFAGAGGDRVHVHLLYPPGHERGRPYPLLQNIHGGPHSLYADAWHWRWNAQALAAPGYVVAMVNFHGSASYGERFTSSVVGDWGGKAAEDILMATDLFVEQGIADPARIAVAGGSFGGYMVAWLTTRTDRFACAIAHAAVYNLASAAADDITQTAARELGGSPWDLPREREAVDRWNPAAHSGALRTPTLVLHGGKDYRVPVEQALELYGVLKARGVPARLCHYPDEGHWIAKKRNALHWYGEVHAWLARWLG